MDAGVLDALLLEVRRHGQASAQVIARLAEEKRRKMEPTLRAFIEQNRAILKRLR